MLKIFLKNLIYLSLISFVISGCTQESHKRLFLIDISGSNLKNSESILKKVNDIYMEGFPSDQYEVEFFSSAKYLAYKGSRLSKDRDFLPIIEKGFESAKQIRVSEGTSFGLFKEAIEKHNDSVIYIFTDGFFEDSK